MSKQTYGVTSNSSVTSIKARAIKLKLGVPLIPGDGSVAAVLAHIKALDLGYQKPTIITTKGLFLSAADMVAAQSVASQYRASFLMEGAPTKDLPSESSKEVISAIAELLREMGKRDADPSIVRQVIGRPPYGYVRIDKRLMIDSGTAALIAECFQLKDTGKSIDKICEEICIKFPAATTTSTKKHWHKARVARILRQAEMYRHGKFRNCDGKRYTNSKLVIAPPSKEATV